MPDNSLVWMRNDEADARMAELHERFYVARYAWVCGDSFSARLIRARVGLPTKPRIARNMLDYLSLDAMHARPIRAIGRIVNASGNTVGATLGFTLSLVDETGTSLDRIGALFGVSRFPVSGVSPHA